MSGKKLSDSSLEESSLDIISASRAGAAALIRRGLRPSGMFCALSVGGMNESGGSLVDFAIFFDVVALLPALVIPRAGGSSSSTGFWVTVIFFAVAGLFFLFVLLVVVALLGAVIFSGPLPFLVVFTFFLVSDLPFAAERFAEVVSGGVWMVF